MRTHICTYFHITLYAIFYFLFASFVRAENSTPPPPACNCTTVQTAAIAITSYVIIIRFARVELLIIIHADLEQRDISCTAFRDVRPGKSSVYYTPASTHCKTYAWTPRLLCGLPARRRWLVVHNTIAIAIIFVL